MYILLCRLSFADVLTANNRLERQIARMLKPVFCLAGVGKVDWRFLRCYDEYDHGERT
jgi:hypothetical protein